MLGSDALESLHRAMERQFTPDDMDRLLVERFDVPMHLIAGQKAFQYQVVEIVRHFQTRNTAEQLVLALRDARPRVPELIRVADSLGYTELPAVGFEVLVNENGAAYSDPMDFRTRLSKLEDAVCRIEASGSYGTGVLIGPDKVLTNFHVVERSITAGSLSSPVSCLFGHRRAGTTVTPAKKFHVESVLVFSPPSDDDLQADRWNVDTDKLDYAVLQLASAAGDLPAVSGGESRGWAMVPAESTVAESEPVLILQHPLGQPLKVDIGAITATRQTRLRYNANTDRGSSGAPVFNRLLQLVAIHHVGLDWPKAQAPYNQGVPISMIRAHAAQRNVAL